MEGERLFSIQYAEIIGCEIMVDSQVIGGIKRAVVGGILAGDTGAIVGATTAKKFITSYRVVIYTTSISSPQKVLTLISEQTETKDVNYSNASSFAEKVNATIKAILYKNTEDVTSPNAGGGKDWLTLLPLKRSQTQ